MNHSTKVLVAVILLALQGCGSQRGFEGGSKAVLNAGISPAGASEAVSLAALRPGLSAAGKDYLFVGPMTVNREGSHRRYLWFSVGTTIDRHLTGAPKPTLETVVLVVDGAPMTFDLIPWNNNADAAPYPLPIESYSSYAARITNSQIRQVANAGTVEAYVTDVNGRSPIYSIVGGDPAEWQGFSGYSTSRRD